MLELPLILTILGLAYLLYREKTKPQEEVVPQKSYKARRVTNLSEGALELLTHMMQIVSNKNGRDSNKRLATHARRNESYADILYDFEVFAIANNQPVSNSWYEIPSLINQDVADYIEWLVSEVNKGCNIGIVSNKRERRAILYAPNSVAKGEIVITETYFEFIDWSNQDVSRD